MLAEEFQVVGGCCKENLAQQLQVGSRIRRGLQASSRLQVRDSLQMSLIYLRHH